jgi:ribulose-5-phosphate 4-epimerase/fuculose-1-phosphate aldolase
MALAEFTPPHVGMTEVEWETRVGLAALHRLYVHFGWTDLIYTHITARVPGENDHYLIKPDELLMEEVTASNLVKVDMDGNLIAGDYPPNLAGHLIHTAILTARPELNVLAHTHSRAGAAVSAMSGGLLPISQHANMIIPGIAYHDYQDVTSAEEECAALARDFPAGKTILIMHNHGPLAGGRDVAECFYHLYFIEAACKIQVDVLASGKDPILCSDGIVQGLYTYKGAPENPPTGVRVWPAMLRLLDRRYPDYKT